jgi:hypothetical protein
VPAFLPSEPERTAQDPSAQSSTTVDTAAEVPEPTDQPADSPSSASAPTIQAEDSLAPEGVQPIAAFGFIPSLPQDSCAAKCTSMCSNLSEEPFCLQHCTSSFCTVAPEVSHWYLWVLSFILFSVAFGIYWSLNHLGKRGLRPQETELSQYYTLSG